MGIFFENFRNLQILITKKMRACYLNTTKEKLSRYIIGVSRYSILCERRKWWFFGIFLKLRPKQKNWTFKNGSPGINGIHNFVSISR